MRTPLKSAVAALACAAALAATAGAQTQPRDAAESDPRTLGWMQGTPPPPDRQITAQNGDYFAFPQMRWTVCNIRALFPTVEVARGPGPATPLPRPPAPEAARIAAEIDALTFTPLGGGAPMTWRAARAASYADGLLILHGGRIVYEWYSGCLTETGTHAAMSMTKSTIGLMAEILVAEGRLEASSTAADIVPELAGTAFGDATVRQVMDMTTGIAFDEDYDNPDADIWAYAAAGSPFPRPAGAGGPLGYLAYVPTVARDGAHGAAFGYRTVNTDVLAWIVARVAGQPIQTLLSDRIWGPMGAERAGYFTVDAVGTPFAGGGLSAGLRDLGRLGLLLLDGGMIDGRRLFPAAAVDSIRAGGDRAAFAKAGYDTIPGGSYRSMFWVFHDDHGAFAARGVHGQTIYVDPAAGMVIVRVASHPSAKNARIDPVSLPAYRVVADYLMGAQ